MPKKNREIWWWYKEIQRVVASKEKQFKFKEKKQEERRLDVL